MNNPTGNVLIVDDTPANLDLLGRVLREHGYKVRAVPSGTMAVSAVMAAPPDLIMMDINMPGMDGYEACRQIKKDPRFEGLPVIFLSALDDAKDKVKAFEAGGSDYVTKPFQAPEVLARVGHHIQLARLQGFLEEKNGILLEANAKLQELDRLKADFTSMLVHDLRNPLSLLSMAFEIYQEEKEIPERLLAGSQSAIQKCTGLVSSLLEIFRSESGDVTPEVLEVDTLALFHELETIYRPLMEGRGLHFETAWPQEPPPLKGDREHLDRIFSNLLGNALKFTPAGGTIGLKATVVDGQGVEKGFRWLSIEISDSGRGIPLQEINFIFDPFRQARNTDRSHGVGLGLAIVHRFISEHHGRIEVQSQVGIGTVFKVFLPV